MKVLILIACACAACGASPLSPSPTRIDVLEFLIGAETLWPRTGDQFQHQIVDRANRRVCWVKYGRPHMYECWRWDEQWIYHALDAALDGDRPDAYRFTDGRFLPRYLEGRWTLDVTDNRVEWFNGQCQRITGPEGVPMPDGPPLFPYRVSAWIDTAPVDRGAVAGREVLILEYAPHPPNAAPTGNPERFHFAKGAGWYRWGRGPTVRLFDELGGPAVTWQPRACGH